MSNQPTARPVVGHHAAWGLGTSHSRPQPFKLSPGASDTMCVRVREKIDIHGVGTDVVEMEGTFTVRRDHPCQVSGAGEAKWGESCVKTEFRSLELYGESPVFGTVRVHLDPSRSSHGEVGPAEEGSLAASCVAHCFPVIEMPELGLKLTTQGVPINLASKVVQIPPVGDVARSENSAALVDEFNNRVGEIVSSDIEVGEVVCSFPLGKTGSHSGQTHEHEHGHGHTPHSHPDPSGPSFYAEAPATSGGSSSPGPSHGGSHVPGHSHGGSGSHQHDHSHPQPPGTAPDLSSTLARLEEELRALTGLVRELAGR